MVDFSQYQTPGVYVSEQTTPLVSNVGVDPTLVTLVGPARGFNTQTDRIVLTGTAAVRLFRLGVIPSSVVVTRGDNTVAAVGTATTGDYFLTVGAGADGIIGNTHDNTTDIARSSASTITSASTVFVTYNYVEADYSSPKRYADFDSIKAAYGEPLDLDTGAVLSPISLAAQIAFANGANEIVGLPTEGTLTAAKLAAAYTKLTARFDTNVIVPLTNGLADADVATVGSDLRNHLVTTSAGGGFRVGILGFDQNVTQAPDITAAAVASSRVVLAYPNRLNFYIGPSAKTITLGGQYLAAGMAGRLSSQPVQTGLTRKVIRGLAGINEALSSTLTKTLKDTYSNAGVAVVESDRAGRLVIRHGTTTDRSNVNTRELSVVRAKDALVDLVQTGMDDADMVGDPIDIDTPLRVKSIVAGVLEAAVTFGVVVAYTNLKVRQLSTNPSVIEVRFGYRPAYPLNYIVVAFSINVQTGETSITDDAAA